MDDAKAEWVAATRAERILREQGYRISNRKIKRLIRDGLLKVNSKNQINWYRLKSILDAELSEKTSKIEQEQDYAELLKRANAKYREEKARLAELERRKKEGELISVADVRKLLTEIGTVLRTQLEAAEEKLASQISPFITKRNQKKARTVIKEWKNEVFNMFYSNSFKFKEIKE